MYLVGREAFSDYSIFLNSVGMEELSSFSFCFGKFDDEMASTLSANLILLLRVVKNISADILSGFESSFSNLSKNRIPLKKI